MACTAQSLRLVMGAAAEVTSVGFLATIESMWDEKERVLPADTVVVAGPRHSRQELARALEFSVDEVEVIGDAVSPRAVHHGIREAHLIGYSSSGAVEGAARICAAEQH